MMERPMKNSGHRSIALVGAAIVIAACSSPSAPPWRPSLRTDASSYVAGGTISATVNSAATNISFGACPLRLERWVGGEWAQLAPPTYDCDASLLVLPRGRADTILYFLDRGLESGKYRLVMGVMRSERFPDQLRSAAFVVRASG
jgi:hypothetical protein